jgi:hypothetical protein
MRVTTLRALGILFILAAPVAAAGGAGSGPGTAAAAGSEDGGGARLTIYNQDFALVKETRALKLKEGVNEVRVADVTALVEPDSVVLRDARGGSGLRILEQNYVNDPLSQGALLRQYEGKTVTFRLPCRDDKCLDRGEDGRLVTGKVIRSGYVPPDARGGSQETTPIIEVNGKLRFSLPGEPVFDALADDAILKPTLLWQLWTDRAGERQVDLSYLTGGMRWQATYNLVLPEKGDRFDLVGWVTLDNNSGTEFANARIRLMAGDVSKVQQPGVRMDFAKARVAMESDMAAPQVTEKTFDEYHLYTLQRPTTLRNRETKLVEFTRAAGVPSTRLYVYDGAQIPEYGPYASPSMLQSAEYGTQSNTKIYAMLEFMNDKASGLGLALPRGTMKLYRLDTDGSQEFVGENVIDHTPENEKVRLYTGNAFDLVGERRQTDFRVDTAGRSADESFEIKVRNRKKEPAEIRVVEHLYRWAQWKIAASSVPYGKTDAKTIEFRVKVPADAQQIVTYRVHYTW